MVLRIYLFVLCSSCMALSACGGGNVGADAATNTTIDSTKGNNVALLTGPQLGNETENNADLSKPITVRQNSSDFEVSQATVTRDDTKGSYFYVTIQLTNISTQVLCETTLSNVEYQSVTNGITTNRALTSEGYLLGSYGKMASGIRRSNCLAPGQSGYFLDGIQDDGSFTFDELNTVDISSISVTVADKISTGQIAPESYSVTADSTGVTANVSVRNNTGYGAVIYSPGCRYILLDEHGMPLIWGYLLTDPTSADILPNGSLQISGGVSFTGSARKMVVYLMWSNS